LFAKAIFYEYDHYQALRQIKLAAKTTLIKRLKCGSVGEKKQKPPCCARRFWKNLILSFRLFLYGNHVGSSEGCYRDQIVTFTIAVIHRAFANRVPIKLCHFDHTGDAGKISLCGT